MRVLRTLTAALLLVMVSTTGVATARSATGNQAAVSGGVRGGVIAVEASNAPSIPSTSTLSAPRATDRVIVHLKGSATRSTLAGIARSARTSVAGVHNIRRDRLVWTAPKGVSAEAFAKKLMASGKVEYAVPDYVRKLVGYTPPAYVSPNDPAFTSTRGVVGYSDARRTRIVEKFYNAYSWWLRDIRAPQAWAEGYTGSDTVGKYPLRADGPTFKVAVLDSGLYDTHEDAGVTIVPGRDCFDHELNDNTLYEDNTPTPVPPQDMPSTEPFANRLAIASHGTCIAGEIGATVNNSLGTVGVGYDTQVVVYKVMGRFKDGSVGIDDWAVHNAIQHATDNGAKVINMSFGGYQPSQDLTDAINYAHDHGVIVVAAKGNDASNAAFYPAANAHVVSVGALDKNASGVTVPASFTNYYHTSLDIMAPGALIWGLSAPGYNPDPSLATTGYAVWDGTSMSSPIVAGALAWLWRAAPALNADEITGVVLNSAAKKGATTHFPSGYRALDMYAAYKALEAGYPLLGKPGVVDQTVAPLGGTVTVPWGVLTSPTRGVTYDVSLDDTPIATATADTARVFAWGPNTSHTIRAQAHSAFNWDDGTAIATATIQVLPVADGPSSWSPAHVTGGSAISATPGYHQYTPIEATLRDTSSTPLAGASVVLESSTDGVNFAAAGGSVYELPNGVYRTNVSQERRTFYRLRFETTGTVIGATSSALTVTPKVAVSTPRSKSSVKRSRKFTVSGTLRPAHSTSSRVVKLAITRWNGHRWAAYSSAWTREIGRGSYSTYSAKIKLKKKGSYRIYAVAVADSRHAVTTSGYKSVRVK